jgi:hypothetical protein
MTELQYPSTTGSERELLIEYLDWYRAAILRKVEGASEETLRARVVPSQTTLLGMVKHLAWVEIWWFQMVMAGRQIEEPWGEDDPDADFRIEPHETTELILNFYREACAESSHRRCDRRLERRVVAGRAQEMEPAPNHDPHDRGDGASCRPCRHHSGAQRRADGALKITSS